MFHYTVTTDKGWEETVAAVEKSLKNYQFDVLWQMNIPSKLQEKGLDFNIPYQVLEVCSTLQAGQALQENLLVGYFIPSKIVVYRDPAKGKTKIGMVRPTYMIGLVDDDAIGLVGDARLRSIAEQVELYLKRAIDQAV